MGDPQLDDSVANLERFNQTLSSLTPRLQEAAEDLTGHVGALEHAADELRAKVADAHAAVHDVEVEVSTFASAAETEAQGLDGIVMEEFDAAMNTLDGSVRELIEGDPHEVAARAGTLEHDLEELRSQGFGHLHEAFAHVGDAFDGWGAAAATALEEVDHDVHAAIEQLAHDRELFDEADTFVVLHSDHTGWSPVQQATHGVEEQTPYVFAQAGVGDGLASAQASLLQQAHAAAHDLREKLAGVVHEVGEEVSQRTLALVNAVDDAVQACEVAEHGAGQAADDATGAAQRATALADLAQKIETADGEVQQIRSVMEAMDAP
jgi:hypothetical protein